MDTVERRQHTALPPTLRAALRAEIGRARRPPYETVSVVIGNGLLMTACWTLLPASVVNMVFTFHGPRAFALVLASWMYSDVPATNLLGGDPHRGIAALPDPVMLRRMWYAKNLVLWLLATPICAAVAIGFGIWDGKPTATILSIVWIAVVPLGALGFSAWLGIRYPYHVLPLAYRWAHRRAWWRMLVRWMVLVLAPYGLVPVLTLLVTLPSLGYWTLTAPGGDRSRISDWSFAVGLLISAVIAIVAWTGGHRLGTRLANRRRVTLTGFLDDPTRG